MTLTLMDMRMSMEQCGIFDNYTFATETNKLENGLINQFVCYHWLQQNQMNSEYIIMC